MIRRALLAFGLLASLATSALAQSNPIPALPDSIRLTTYTISGTTCACAVGFQIYGDNTDVDSWVKVVLNGQQYLSTDPTFGWTLTSPSGSLSFIPRPITDGVITFNSPQTGTVVILGAQRPRRLSEFAENQGVTAHAFNQIFNAVFAELREAWDRGQVQLGSIIVPVRSSAAATVTVSATTDYFLCLDPSGNAINVALPASPAAGLSYLIKDCTGHANSHGIIITPASGNIDGGSNFSISTNFQSVAVTYTGAQWSIN